MPTSLFVFLLGFEAKIGKEKMVFHELVFSSTNFSSTNLLNFLVSRYIDTGDFFGFCLCLDSFVHVFNFLSIIGSVPLLPRTKYYFCRARLSKNISVTSSFKTFFFFKISKSEKDKENKMKK